MKYVLDENNQEVASMDSVEAFWFNNCFFKRDERESCGHSLINYRIDALLCCCVTDDEFMVVCTFFCFKPIVNNLTKILECLCHHS